METHEQREMTRPTPGTRADQLSDRDGNRDRDRDDRPAPKSTPEAVVVPPAPRVTRDEALTGRRDRIRWGSVWAGLVVSLGIYLVLQLALVSTGAIDLAEAQRNDAWLSAGVALLAFLIGGITTGASSLWSGLDDGVLHGIIMWAVGVVALLVLSVVGSGLALGALDASGAFEQVGVDLDEGTVDGVETALGAEDAEEAASWVLLGLGAALLAAAIGGAAGAKLWPRNQTVRIDELDHRERF
jgi:hypothetical protein